MALLEYSKLHKLTIKGFEDRERKKRINDEFKAMFNPSSYSQKYGILYGKHIGLNSSGQQVDFVRSKPSTLSITLILDGNDIHGDSPKPVSEQVKKFLKLAYHVRGKNHEPSYLTVVWGDTNKGGLDFNCRLSSIDITYTSFYRDGSPLRAKLALTLLSDEEVIKREAKVRKSSPDLTHHQVVRNGDTLPFLTKEIYGTADYYLQVAQVNNLDNFRNLTPGQVLVFPPLANKP